MIEKQTRLLNFRNQSAHIYTKFTDFKSSQKIIDDKCLSLEDTINWITNLLQTFLNSDVYKIFHESYPSQLGISENENRKIILLKEV